MFQPIWYTQRPFNGYNYSQSIYIRSSQSHSANLALQHVVLQMGWKKEAPLNIEERTWMYSTQFLHFLKSYWLLGFQIWLLLQNYSPFCFLILSISLNFSLFLYHGKNLSMVLPWCNVERIRSTIFSVLCYMKEVFNILSPFYCPQNCTNPTLNNIIASHAGESERLMPKFLPNCRSSWHFIFIFTIIDWISLWFGTLVIQCDIKDQYSTQDSTQLEINN